MVSEEPKIERCRRCQLPVSNKGISSLTQWILICTCSIETTSEVAGSDPDICNRCGKRISPGRAGSFTQWILRADLCQCDFPMKLTPRIGVIEIDQEATGVSEDEQSADLQLSSDRFPLDRFAPLSVLGTGATSCVYKCRDRLLNKVVSIKCLQDFRHEALVQFQREAKLVTTLNHSNIVSVFDFGITSESVPYMVMEFSDGISLSEFIEENHPLPDEIVVDFAIQICAGLKHAHSKGILHHDLKPSNILVTRDASGFLVLKLIDFGLAVNHDYSAAENLGGSLYYMPPDQAAGKPYDERSEIYSTGCVLFELLCGEPPFHGDSNIELLRKHAQDAPPSIANHRYESSSVKFFDSIIEKCLSKEPDDRFSSPVLLARRLEEFGAVEERAPESDDENTRGTAPANRLLLAGVIFGALAFGAWLVVERAKIPTIDEKENAVDQPVDNPIKNPMESLVLMFSIAPNGKIVPNEIANFKDSNLKEIWVAFSREEMRGKTLSLQGCSLMDGTGLKHLHKAPLAGLNLNATSITDKNMVYVGRLQNLRWLSLSYTRVSNIGLKKISRLSKLKSLFLFGNHNIDDSALITITRQFPNLQVLSFSSSNLTAKGLSALNQLKKLRRLNIQGSGIDNDTIKQITRLSRLKKLNLVDPAITDQGVVGLAKANSLEDVSFEGQKKFSDLALKKLRQSRPDMKVRDRSWSLKSILKEG